MALTRTTRVAAATSALALSLCVFTACSSDDSDSEATSSSAMAPATSMAAESSASPAAAGALVGPGCADYAKANPTGPASVDAIAQVPVATAASNIPMLKTLTQAVSGKLNPSVNLVETLNGGQFTVFAPTDDAFAKLPADTVEKLKTDDALLTKILTYHVVPGQAAPDAIDGEHETVQKEKVRVTGSGDQLKVNDAGVICGGLKTANATVYLIDSVLMPPA